MKKTNVLAKQLYEGQVRGTARQLPQSFYARDTHTVARELLGKLLVRQWRGRVLIARIWEVESYVGQQDKACHASRGMTPRTKIMFGEAGRAYVYLIYGMYHCLNVVTERVGFPAAVLIRGARLVTSDAFLLDGPGKLCRALYISRAQNNYNLFVGDKLFVASDGYKVDKKDIVTAERIGVDYAGEDARLKWRYTVKEA